MWCSACAHDAHRRSLRHGDCDLLEPGRLGFVDAQIRKSCTLRLFFWATLIPFPPFRHVLEQLAALALGARLRECRDGDEIEVSGPVNVRVMLNASDTATVCLDVAVRSLARCVGVGCAA